MARRSVKRHGAAILTDLRLAFRTLSKTPFVTAVAVVSLAFGYPMFHDLERVRSVFTGLAAHQSFSANRATRGQTLNADGALFELEGYDPVVLTSSALLLAVVAGVAGLLPAPRAARIQPMAARPRD